MEQSKITGASASKFMKVYRFVVLPIYLIACIFFYVYYNAYEPEGIYTSEKIVVALSYLALFASIAMIVYLIAGLGNGSLINIKITVAMLTITPVLPYLDTIYIHMLELAVNRSTTVSTLAIVISYAITFLIFSLPQIIYLKKNEWMFYTK